jgi:hypothetical protein
MQAKSLSRLPLRFPASRQAVGAHASERMCSGGALLPRRKERSKDLREGGPCKQEPPRRLAATPKSSTAHCSPPQPHQPATPHSRLQCAICDAEKRECIYLLLFCIYYYSSPFFPSRSACKS